MKINFGYGMGAIGYMVGVFLLAGSSEAVGSAGSVALAIGNLLDVLLFAGLSCCLLLSVNEGRWYRPLSSRLYAMIASIAGGYAIFAAWAQSGTGDRYAASGEIGLRLCTIAAFVLVHRFAAGQRTRQ